MKETTVDEPGYSIRVTARLTGISVDQLRVWERRYGFPSPKRTPSGVRTYTQTDVVRLRLIARALDSGWQARDAVLADPDDLRRTLSKSGQTGTQRLEPSASESVTRQLLDKLKRNEFSALKMELRHLAAQHGPKGFVTEVVAPLVRAVGEAWARGGIDVRHEHLVTQMLSSQLRLLGSAYEDGSSRTPSVLLATLPDERHGLGLEMVSLYVAAFGAQPRLLGVDTPPVEIVRAATDLRADAVGLSVSSAASVRDTAQQVAYLRSELPAETELWLGGAGAAAAAREGDGVHCIRDFGSLESALTRLRQQSR